MRKNHATVSATATQIDNLPGEVWKDVLGYEGFYQASNMGRVKSLPRTVRMVDGRKYTVRGKVLKDRSICEYRVVCLSKGGREFLGLVHRLVLLAFRGAPKEGQECRHLNGDRTDNRLKNLMWGTPLEQARDRERHGTTIRDRRGATHKLKGRHEEVLLLWKSGVSMCEIARRLDVLVCSISYIIRVKYKQ